MATLVLTRPNGSSGSGTSSALELIRESASGPITPSALGVNSLAVGNGSTALAENSIAIGLQSLARIKNSVVQAGGRFASSGDAQVGRYLLRGVTVTSATVDLLVDSSPVTRLELPDNSTWTVKGVVTAHRTDADDGHAGYEFSCVIYRGSGAATTAIQGSVIKSVISESNPTWDINITADSTNGSLRVSVKGETGKTIRWLAFIETVEVTN